MATKRPRTSPAKRVKTSAPKSRGKAAPPASQKAAERFVRGILVRGEAAECDESGELPLEATHEIVAKPKGKLPVIRRRRFKLV